jgi:hypothetical protein
MPRIRTNVIRPGPSDASSLGKSVANVAPRYIPTEGNIFPIRPTEKFRIAPRNDKNAQIFISFGKNENEKRTLALCFLILTSSSTVLRWTVADLTDSLHLTLFALCCLGIYKNWSFRTLAIIIVFGAAIRPMGPVWAALFIPFLIRQTDRSKKAYFYLALISIILFLVNTILMALFGGFAPNSNPLFSQIAAVPRNFFVILFVEFGQLAVLDRLLFYTVLLTLGLAILNYRDMWSLIHINVSFACFLISAWVGVWGVNFRYELPLLVTGTLVVLRKFNSKVR